MANRPAQIHCDGLAIKEFVSAINHELYTSLNKRDPSNQIKIFNLCGVVVASPQRNNLICFRYKMGILFGYLQIPKDPVLHELYGHFRSYWPDKPVKKSKSKEDGYLDPSTLTPSNPQPEESKKEGGTDLHEIDGMDDVDLARALGVPSACIEKMTPRKSPSKSDAPVSGEANGGKAPVVESAGELTAAQLRDLRIKELEPLELSKKP